MQIEYHVIDNVRLCRVSPLANGEKTVRQLR